MFHSRGTALSRFSSTCMRNTWPLTSWNPKWRDAAVTALQSVMFNAITSSLQPWLTRCPHRTAAQAVWPRRSGGGGRFLKQVSTVCFAARVKLTPEIAAQKTNLVSQATNKSGNKLGKTKDSMVTSDSLQKNMEIPLLNDLLISIIIRLNAFYVQCSLCNCISHIERKKIQLHSSHIFIDVGCLRPSCLVSYTKVPFFVSPHVFVSLSAAKSDSTDVSQKTKQTQKEKSKKRRYSCRGTSSKFSHFKNLRWEIWLLDSVWPQTVIRFFHPDLRLLWSSYLIVFTLEPVYDTFITLFVCVLTPVWEGDMHNFLLVARATSYWETNVSWRALSVWCLRCEMVPRMLLAVKL